MNQFSFEDKQLDALNQHNIQKSQQCQNFLVVENQNDSVRQSQVIEQNVSILSINKINNQKQVGFPNFQSKYQKIIFVFLVVFIILAFCLFYFMNLKNSSKSLQNSSKNTQLNNQNFPEIDSKIIQNKHIKYQGVYGKNPKVFTKQTMKLQNGTQVVISILVQNQQNSVNKSQLINETNKIVPAFMWIGDNQFPDRYKLMLSSLTSYIYIQNCQALIQRIQKMSGQQLSPQVKLVINQKSDVCRIMYLYLYGGLYSDLDVKINQTCINTFLKNRQNHFQQSQNKGKDIFFIYVKEAKNVQLQNILKNWNFYHVYKKGKHFSTMFLDGMKSKQIGRSNCVQHFKQSSYIDKELTEALKN